MNYASPNNVNIQTGGYPPPMPPGTAVVWMQKPNPIPGCPHGLEYLLQLNEIQVEQIPSLLEAFVGWEKNNKYVLKNSAGQQFFYAMEDTDTCMRVCCGAQRGFKIHIVDNTNQEVIKVTREFKCCAGCGWCAGCCGCCAHELTIESPPGQVIGYVRQKGSFWKAAYHILDENHEPVLKIEGPCCICDGPCCPVENQFKILTVDGKNQIGKIAKKYAGFVREAFTNADRFNITFPIDLSVKAKATLIGALFLIDFMFFETKQNSNNSMNVNN